MLTSHATLVAAAVPATPPFDPKRATVEASESSSSTAPARFADADLDSAYAVLATRFPEETFSHAFVIGGAGSRKLQVDLVAALVAVTVLIVAGSLS